VSVSLRQLPNLISSARILLIPPITVALVHDNLGMTLGLFAVAAVSDGADGLLAKRFGWQTELGAILDPAADKLLLTTVFVTLAFLGAIPIWLMLATISRDLVIVLGAVAFRVYCGPLQIRPSVISKLNTVGQLLFVASVIAERRFAVPPAWVITALGAFVLLTVVISGLDYVLRFTQRGVQIRRLQGASAGSLRGTP
jgi:cardiolipin synthase